MTGANQAAGRSNANKKTTRPAPAHRLSQGQGQGQTTQDENGARTVTKASARQLRFGSGGGVSSGPRLRAGLANANEPADSTDTAMQPQRQRGAGKKNRKKGQQANNQDQDQARRAKGTRPADSQDVQVTVHQPVPARTPTAAAPAAAGQCGIHATGDDEVQAIARAVKASALSMPLAADAQRQKLGEGLFPLVLRIVRDQDLASKITGMLIEDHARMLDLLDSPAASAALGDLINQAGVMLTNQAAQPLPLPPAGPRSVHGTPGAARRPPPGRSASMSEPKYIA